jgi:CBS domain-containing protein
MATVADVLARKNSRVYGIAPTATVLEATQLMNRHNIGALVVTMDGGGCERVIGMFTERDVLTRVVAEQRDPMRTLVEDVMSTNVAFCHQETEIDEVGGIMRERRIRHLPVCENDGELKGLISIGDINAWHADGQAIAIHYLHEYIHGRV